MTAGALPEDRQRCLDAGMDDYIAKPVDLDALEMILDERAGLPVDPLPGLELTQSVDVRAVDARAVDAGAIDRTRLVHRARPRPADRAAAKPYTSTTRLGSCVPCTSSRAPPPRSAPSSSRSCAATWRSRSVVGDSSPRTLFDQLDTELTRANRALREAELLPS